MNPQARAFDFPLVEIDSTRFRLGITPEVHV